MLDENLANEPQENVVRQMLQALQQQSLISEGGVSTDKWLDVL